MKIAIAIGIGLAVLGLVLLAHLRATKDNRLELHAERRYDLAMREQHERLKA